MKQWTIALIPLLTITILAFMYGCRELNNRRQSTGAVKALYHKDAAAFFNEFELNEENSNVLYNDKVISVTGTVMQVTQEDSVQSVLLGEDSGVNGILCQLEPGHKQAEELKPGLVIQIKGICTGLFMDVVMVRCVREKIPPRKRERFREL